MHAGNGDVVVPRAAQHLGVGLVLVAFHGQAEALVRARREHQLRQQAAAVAFLRIGGCGAAGAADLAHVLGLLALAMAYRHQSRPAFAAERRGGAAEQAVPVALVAELEAEVAVLAVLEVIRGILGDEGDNAAERVGAVQRTGRAAHYLDALERVEVDEVAVGVGEAADRERVRHRDAVDLDAHAVAAEAADADVAEAEAAGAVGHGDAGLVAEQVLEVADQQLVHALAFDHVDRVRHVGDGALGAGGGDHDAAEFGGDVVVGIGRRGGRKGLRAGDAGQGDAQGQGQQGRTHAGLVCVDTRRAGVREVRRGLQPWNRVRRALRGSAAVGGAIGAVGPVRNYLVRISLSLRVWRRR